MSAHQPAALRVAHDSLSHLPSEAARESCPHLNATDALIPFPTAALPSADIRLLGPLDVRLRGEQFNSYRTHRVKTLLAYLSCHLDIPQDRGALLELFWPNLNTTEDMRQTLSRLRKVLELAHLDGLLVASRQSICLNSGPGLSTDLTTFQTHLRQWQEHCGSRHQLCDACHRALLQGLELYRGDFCLEVTTDYSEELQRWHTGQQEKLRQDALQGLKALIASYLSGHQLREAEQTIRRLLSIEPFDEEALRLLLTLLCQRGAKGDAEQYFEQWQRRLRREVGIPPEQTTRTLVRGLFMTEPRDSDGLALPTSKALPRLGASLSTEEYPRDSISLPTAQRPRRGRLQNPAPPDHPESVLASCLEMLGQSQCRLVTICNAPLHPHWLQLLLGGLRSHRQGQLHVITLEEDATQATYRHKLNALFPLPCMGIPRIVRGLPSSLAPGPSEQELIYTQHGERICPTATSTEPVLLLQQHIDRAHIDVTALLERLCAYPQLQVLSLATGPLRLQVEHRLYTHTPH